MAFEQIGHPLTLRLGQRHDGAQRLDEADEIQIRMLRRDDVQVGRQAVGFGLEKIPVEEGKGDVVAGRKDDDIDSGLGPIDEASPVAGEAFEVGADIDLAVADEVEQVVGDSRVFGAEGVVGRGEAVPGLLAARQEQQGSKDQALEPERQARCPAKPLPRRRSSWSGCLIRTRRWRLPRESCRLLSSRWAWPHCPAR